MLELYLFGTTRPCVRTDTCFITYSKEGCTPCVNISFSVVQQQVPMKYLNCCSCTRCMWENKNLLVSQVHACASSTPCTTVLEKLTVTHLVKKFPAFYETRRFITVFATAHHWSLSWARCIPSTTSRPASVRSILILSSHLHVGLPSGLFLSGFPTKVLFVFLISYVRSTRSAHLILLELIALKVFG